jgi:hypothetical protein
MIANFCPTLTLEAEGLNRDRQIPAADPSAGCEFAAGSDRQTHLNNRHRPCQFIRRVSRTADHHPIVLGLTVNRDFPLGQLRAFICKQLVEIHIRRFGHLGP